MNDIFGDAVAVIIAGRWVHHTQSSPYLSHFFTVTPLLHPLHTSSITLRPIRVLKKYCVTSFGLYNWSMTMSR